MDFSSMPRLETCASHSPVSNSLHDFQSFHGSDPEDALKVAHGICEQMIPLPSNLPNRVQGGACDSTGSTSGASPTCVRSSAKRAYQDISTLRRGNNFGSVRKRLRFEDTTENEGSVVSSNVLSLHRIMPRLGRRVQLVKVIQKTRYLEYMSEKDLELSMRLVWLLEHLSEFEIESCNVGLEDEDLDGDFPTLLLKFGNDGRYEMDLCKLEMLVLYNDFYHHFLEKDSIVKSLENRIVAPPKRLPRSMDWLNTVLPASPDHIFEHHTRMTRRSFGMLVLLLETRAPEIFGLLKKRGCKQLPVSRQLHLAMFCFGLYGNGASLEQGRALMGYGVGTIARARDRVTEALMKLNHEYIRWPTAESRKEMRKAVKKKYGFKWMFFTVDGTMHNFAFVPGYDSTSWYTRKSTYSMQALVSSDMDRRVIHLVVGWPGSAHDSRVLKSADYMDESRQSEFFTGNEHGLGDAAFGFHRRVVPNYKEPWTRFPENVVYNRWHSKARIRAEHTIGLVKSRFQGLREIRQRLAKRQHAAQIAKFITAGYVLHNILLDFNDSFDPEPARDLESETDMHGADSDAEDEAMVQGITTTVARESARQFREIVKHQVLRFIKYE